MFHSGSVVGPRARCAKRRRARRRLGAVQSAHLPSSVRCSPARATPSVAPRDDPIDVVLQNEHPLDPIAEPDLVADQLAKFVDIGATGVNVRFVHHSPAHYREQLIYAPGCRGIYASLRITRVPTHQGAQMRQAFISTKELTTSEGMNRATINAVLRRPDPAKRR